MFLCLLFLSDFAYIKISLIHIEIAFQSKIMSKTFHFFTLPLRLSRYRRIMILLVHYILTLRIRD